MPHIFIKHFNGLWFFLQIELNRVDNWLLHQYIYGLQLGKREEFPALFEN